MSDDQLSALNNYMQTNFASLYADPLKYDATSGQFQDAADSNIVSAAMTSDFGASISWGSLGMGFPPYVLYVGSGSLYTSGTGASATFTASATTTTGGDTKSMADVSVLTAAEAQTTISSVDEALKQIDTERGKLGAVQNRFESTISNLQNVSENLSSARSRILDADIAAETSAMTKNNILQQAGASILSQANQAPQLALSLLQ